MSQPKKLLFIHHGSGQGGAAVSLHTLIKHLDRSSFDISLVFDKRFESNFQFFTDLNVKLYPSYVCPFVHTSSTWRWHTLKGSFSLLRWILYELPITISSLSILLARVNPDIVHLNGLSLLIYSPLLFSISL